MRSMWKGAISFGLVTIPVQLYAAAGPVPDPGGVKACCL